MQNRTHFESLGLNKYFGGGHLFPPAISGQVGELPDDLLHAEGAVVQKMSSTSAGTVLGVQKGASMNMILGMSMS